MHQETISYQANPCHLLAALADENWPVLLDSSHRARFDIISANPTQKIVIHDPKDAPHAFEAIKKALGPLQITHNALPFIGGAIGYFGYDLGFGLEPLTARRDNDLKLPVMAIGIYDWAIVTDHDKKETYYIHQNPNKKHRAWIENRLHYLAPPKKFSTSEELTTDSSAIDYAHEFSRVKKHIAAGDCYQVNLSQRFSCQYEGDPLTLYEHIREKNPTPYAAYLNFDDTQILCASPESFLHIKNHAVTTRPIKGTRPRSDDKKLDSLFAKALLKSDKDRAENLMIVDLLRNDLAKTAETGSVEVPQLFALESHPSVHHLVSTITATLKKDKHPIDCFKACFPGGSITGAPKIRAMKIIESLELYRRQVYCGSIGYISFDGQLNTNIAIRTLIATDTSLYTWAGGGIVADSVMEQEHQELHDKVRPFYDAVNTFKKGENHDHVA
jgi:para-aminobenzoate synthetase component I